ncbi:hypothetical protein GGR50DRAFT_114538 [Xylaria sp. CBS 124048]|nr:hypothetical protein GGR50DRAFT_114538 [Xylaria sp. CBS 124048]
MGECCLCGALFFTYYLCTSRSNQRISPHQEKRRPFFLTPVHRIMVRAGLWPAQSQPTARRETSRHTQQPQPTLSLVSSVGVEYVLGREVSRYLLSRLGRGFHVTERERERESDRETERHTERERELDRVLCANPGGVTVFTSLCIQSTVHKYIHPIWRWRKWRDAPRLQPAAPCSMLPCRRHGPGCADATTPCTE